MAEMEQVLRGLTRGLPFEVLDNGYAPGLSFFPRTHTLGVVLPSNSPGVHSLWLPAIALKTALVLQARQRRAVDSVSNHSGADQGRSAAGGVSLLPVRSRGRRPRFCAITGRGMVFGDVSTTQSMGQRSAHRNPWTGLQQGDPRRR